ncbi:MAG: hypothetical protein HC774_08260 [Sphingomonadales bacterium]|nr:hypothetical protein [Sphingomonadales bacterium]
MGQRKFSQGQGLPKHRSGRGRSQINLELFQELNRVVIHDDDHYYLAGVLAELLVAEGTKVTFVTPSAKVSEWAGNTLEQGRIQSRLMSLGVSLELSQAVTP